MNYEVEIMVKHRFDVEAETMEDAAIKARDFVKAMKPAKEAWGEDMCWEDAEVTKLTASYNTSD